MSGWRGFDANTRVLAGEAMAFAAHGYRFAVRYVRRDQPHSFDLTADELRDILGAGLALMVVQHVESATSWTPSSEKGFRYGHVAAQSAHEAGYENGCTLWLDLEGVSSYTGAAVTIAYANSWFDVVKSAGYEPGIYIGWHCGLTAKQLYRDLKFSHYWGAYNLNADEAPAIRGLCMHQRAAKRADIPAGITYQIDTDLITADNLGGLPTLMVPPEWSPSGVQP